MSHRRRGVSTAAAWVCLFVAWGALAEPISNGPIGVEGDRIGSVVAAAGDFNGDTFLDLAVGAEGFEGGKGAVLLFPETGSGYGTPTTLAPGGTIGFGLGASLAANCRLNDDDFPDIVAGAPAGVSSNGYVVVIFGGTSPDRPQNVTLVSPNQGWRFGTSVACPGDVDGDGHPDLVVGAPTADPNSNALRAGAVFIYSGDAAGGFAPTPQVLWGTRPDESLGQSLASVGDLNADGRAEFVVGAPGDRAIWLFGTSVENPVVHELFPHVPDANGLEGFGFAIAALGDVNGDGDPDLAVGAPYENGEEGAVAVYSVKSAFTVQMPVLRPPAGTLGSGRSVAGPGDVNGDGYADLLVGTASGGALLYLGSATGVRPEPFPYDNPSTPASEFGFAVSGAGDVNADGFADVAIGAPQDGALGPGVVHFFPGSARGPLAKGRTLPTLKPVVSVALLGDVNGDGFGDAAVGQPVGTNETARVFYGARAGLGIELEKTLTIDSVSSGFGAAVAAAGDVNGDGFADLLVGAPLYPDGDGDDSGKVFLYLGGPDGLSPSWAWYAHGREGEAWFGSSAAGAGDVNGDGYDDVIIGAPGTESGKGEAYIFLGGPLLTGLEPNPAWTLPSPSGGLFGSSVAGVGDVNLDGFADVVVTAPGKASAHVYFGRAAGLGALVSEPLGDQYPFEDGLGRDVSGAGDVNGDGVPDFVVAATPANTGEVRAVVYFGAKNWATRPTPTSAVLPGIVTSQVASVAVAGVGDVNGDGLSDVLLSSPDVSVGGSARLFLGNPDLVLNEAAWIPGVGDATFNRFGAAVSGGTDANGDGFGDFVIAEGLNVHGFAGGDLGAGRPFLLKQLTGDGSVRGRGYRAMPGDLVRLKGELRDELASHADLLLEVEVKPVYEPFNGQNTTFSDFTRTGEVVVELPANLVGRFHWRARVVSEKFAGQRLAGHWRAFGGEVETSTDFSVGLPPVDVSDGGVGEDGGVDGGMDGGVGADGGVDPLVFDTTGCNCSSVPVAPAVLVLLALAAQRLRRRRR